MALDGITVAALTYELKNKLLGGRISKISQPENDELMLLIKTNSENLRLHMSAGASLPFIYITDENKPSPATAPGFCMLLRKHISGGHITDISQPGLERIIEFTIDHLDEMGDPCKKILSIELMGKYSNIIFRKPDGTIIDSIKHISSMVSSVREVLPGRNYFIPNTEDKHDLINELSNNTLEFIIKTHVLCKPFSIQKALYQTLTGFSPVLAASLCEEAKINPDKNAASLTSEETTNLIRCIEQMLSDLAMGNFTPAIILDKSDNPVEFQVVPLIQYEVLTLKNYDTVSEVLKNFYSLKNEYTRIRQKSSDLRKIVSTLLERNIKKYDIQAKQLKDTEKMDKYRLYGELLQTYGYSALPGADKLTCDNYYDGTTITIPLDPTISAIECSQKYFNRYTKLKRTKEAVTDLLNETTADIEHLKSIATALDIALKEEDLAQIKDELTDAGYIKRKGTQKVKNKAKSHPFHYLSSDGFHIYVGKNNYQNDELTFKLANTNDWWFHAKKMPGSHVIVRCEGKELTDKTFEEAAALAAYYSNGRQMEKVEVDYVKRKEVKKPSGAKPGFVVYYTNYSLIAIPKIDGLTQISD